MSEGKVILVSGPRFSGKSRFVEQLLPKLREKGLKLTGFFQRGVFDDNNLKTGYNLVSAENGTAVPLARRAGPGSPWEFDETAFERAREMITGGADVIIIDEAGPLELSGGGHARTLETALGMKSLILIVVREELAESLRRWLSGEREVTVLQFVPGAEETLAKRVLEILLA